MSITQWPNQERPREKLLCRGPGALSDAELLAVFLRTGTPGLDAVALSRSLIDRFDGLRGFLTARNNDLLQMPGIGPAKLALLRAALELGRRFLESEMVKSDVISSPAATRRFLAARMRDLRHELFACLFLDARHRVIQFDEMFRGTIDGASVYPREVVSRALEVNAAAVILTHNHPSGVAEPSHADRAITRRLCDALALVDVRVLDHLVVGDGEVVSFAERGLL